MQVWRKCTSDLHFVHPICCCCVGTLCEKVSLQEKKEGVRGEEKKEKIKKRKELENLNVLEYIYNSVVSIQMALKI